MYLLTINGIFFSRSSLMAICSGSVSPSRSTRTGAFMLLWSQPMCPFLLSSCSHRIVNLLPDLQRTRAQYTCFLVFRHIGCSNALFVWDLLLLVRLDVVLRCGRGIARHNHVVGLFVAILKGLAFISGLGLVFLLDVLVIVVGFLTAVFRISRLTSCAPLPSGRSTYPPPPPPTSLPKSSSPP